MDNVKIEIVNGVGKNSGKPYEALKVSVGDWTQLLFPRGAIEWNYIKEQLGVD